ncbi:MAG: ABC transporter ATP-binding protein [Patescibacteria group bacterium]
MNQNTRKTLAHYWFASLRYKKTVSFAVSGVIAASVLNVIVPLYFKKFFDILTNGSAKDIIAKELISVLIIIGVLRLVQWVCWRVATFTASYAQSKAMTDLTDYCFAYLQNHSFGFFTDNFVGSLVKKVKWFGRSFEVISDRVLWDLLPLVVNISIIIAVLFQRDTYLGVGVLVWLVIFFTINAFFIRYKLKYDIQRSEAETKTTGYLADTITNQSTIKLFDGYDREVKGFGAINEELRRLRRLTWDFGNYFEAVQGFLMTFLEIGIFYLAIKLWQQNILTVGDFVLIQAYLINMFMSIWSFGKVIRHIYESLADADEMTAILETPYEVTDAPGARDLRVTAGRIQFEGVDFNYRQTRSVLRQFTLEVAPHERLAIVGSSGAGKTTLVKLLLRMHDVTAGRILIDSQDIAHVTQRSQRRQIGLVPQDPILFHRSLMENIRYGKPGATDGEVIAAAKAANCHEFISTLAEGYNTHVGERGVKLSSGERQRVAIARAILYDAPILVLDEATSSLDSESERLIQEALDRLMAGKTVLAIAHRLSTIRKMDRIIVIDKGGIVEEGTHEILLQKNDGLYKHLWELQAGGFIK